jgi:hypothetical protein
MAAKNWQTPAEWPSAMIGPRQKHRKEKSSGRGDEIAFLS